VFNILATKTKFNLYCQRPGRGTYQILSFVSGLRALVVPEQALHQLTFTFNTSNNRALKA
jgi:hypothetical protein